MPFMDGSEILPVRGSAEADEAATRTVRRQAKREGWTPADVDDLLAALGLTNSPTGGRYAPSTGQRISDSRRNRRKAS